MGILSVWPVAGSEDSERLIEHVHNLIVQRFAG